MVILGLTGSIGMGKSTTARLFADEGVPVHDADAAVHRLYEGEAAPLIEAAFPGTTRNGRVDRPMLASRVFGDPVALRTLEGIVHPLVHKSEKVFLEECRKGGAKVVLLDIPLLFETGAESRVHKVIVVTAPSDMQRLRVFERPGMTEEKFKAVLTQQMPDAEKRRRADFVVDSGRGLEHARGQVRDILAAVAKMTRAK
jgi:dephospho-CoA kinase